MTTGSNHPLFTLRDTVSNGGILYILERHFITRDRRVVNFCPELGFFGFENVFRGPRAVTQNNRPFPQ